MKFAFIGTNFVSDTLMAGASQLSDFELAIVCSRTEEHAKAFAEKYHCNAWCTDYTSITKDQVDAVYIATPNAMHYEETIHFLNKGIHVLCEKPLASNITEVEKMFACADKNHVLLLEAIVPLFTPNFWVIQEAMKEIGTVRRAVFDCGKYSSRYDAYRAGTVMNAFQNKLSNGSIMDMGVYALSDAIALFGKPERILADAYMLESGVDGMGTAILSYADKQVVLMHSKITDSHFDSEIQGEDGTVVIQGLSTPKSVKVITRKGESREYAIEQNAEPKFYEIEEFINCVKSGNYHSNLVPREVTLTVHEVMTEIRKQVKLFYPADQTK